MVNRILDTLGVILFFAMVPLMPITLFVMYVVMDRLGLVGL
jgi:hypothetical protein